MAHAPLGATIFAVWLAAFLGAAVLKQQSPAPPFELANRKRNVCLLPAACMCLHILIVGISLPVLAELLNLF